MAMIKCACFVRSKHMIPVKVGEGEGEGRTTVGVLIFFPFLFLNFLRPFPTVSKWEECI